MGTSKREREFGPPLLVVTEELDRVAEWANEWHWRPSAYSVERRRSGRPRHQPRPMREIMAEAEVEMAEQASRQELFLQLYREQQDAGFAPDPEVIWELVEELMSGNLPHDDWVMKASGF